MSAGLDSGASVGRGSGCVKPNGLRAKSAVAPGGPERYTFVTRDRTGRVPAGREPLMIRPIALLLYMGAALAALPAAAPAARLDLPVQRAGVDAGPRSYAGDLVELRLTPAATRAVLPRAAGPTRARQALAIGLATVDATAAALGGCVFEPEFPGEVPPDDPGAPDFTQFWLAHLAPGTRLEDALDRFAATPGVALALPVATLPVSAIPNDSLFTSCTWLHQVDAPGHDLRAPEAWDVEDGDSSIVVAILDSGVLPYHPDLGGDGSGPSQLWTNVAEANGLPGVDDDGNGYVDDVHGWDFVSKAFSISVAGEDVLDADNDPNDFAGHGTAVAGLVGAIANNGIGIAGVAPEVRLMPLRMAWAVGVQPNAAVSMTYAAQAIRYATRMGATIINASWESIDSTGSGLGAAVTAATRAGVAIANAAGNSSSSAAYLGNRDDVVAVSAVDSNDVVLSPRTAGAWIDVAAQGKAIVSTYVGRAAGTDSVLSYRVPTYVMGQQGTSFASPQAAGLMALLQAQRRAEGRDPLTPYGLLARLRETADDIRPLNPGLVNYGVGRLNAFRALTDHPTTTAVRARAQSVGAPAVIRTNDGLTRVVYAMSDSELVAYDGASADTAWRVLLPAAPVGNPVVLDPRNGSGPIVLVAAANGSVSAFERDGGNVGGGFPITGLGANQNLRLAAGDLDGDGTPEIVATGTSGRVYAWHLDRTLLAGYPFDAGFLGGSAVALADLDGQPGDEILVWSGDGSVHALRADGSDLDGWPYAAAGPGRAPVVAHFAGPGSAPTVLLAAGTTLTALDAAGQVRWTQALAGYAMADLVLGDLDGDGLDEIVAVTGTTISVLDSNGVLLPAHSPQGSLGTVSGEPVVGPLRAANRAGIGARLAAGFAVWDDGGLPVDGFPKPGAAGAWAGLADLDGDGATEIAAGTSLADSNVYAFDAGLGSWRDSLAFWPTTRGDAARTGARRYPVGVTTYDVVPPAAPTGLVAAALDATHVRVTWINSGDDGDSGRAARARISALGFSGSLRVDVEVPVSGSAGSADSAVFVSPEGQAWTVFVTLFDASGNGGPAASDTVLTPGAPPGVIADLRVAAAHDSTVRLAWTAPADDGALGHPASYEVAGAPYAFAPADFANAPLQAQLVASALAGAPESLTVTGLERGRRWTFAVRGVDATGATADPSNLVTVLLGPGGALDGRTGIAIAARPVPGSPPVTLDWQGDPRLVAPRQRLEILDLSGRSLRRVDLGAEPGGNWTWNGRDDDGRAVPAGLYFARLTSGGSHAEARIVLVR